MSRSQTQLPLMVGGVLGLATVVLLAIAVVAGDEAPALASHAGGMDAMSIDMDPTGNTATSPGPRQFCARINENDVLDADEDAIDTVTIDVTATNIPALNPMLGFEYALNYSGDNLTIESDDSSLLLAALPGSTLIDFGDIVPDPNDDGPNVWWAAMIDIGLEDTLESGSGVLTRLAISTEQSAVLGAQPLSFGSAYHVDPENESRYPDSLATAIISVNSPCESVQPTNPPATQSPPLRSADLKAIALDVEVTVIEEWDPKAVFELTPSLHLNGPDPLDQIRIDAHVAMPEGCSASVTSTTTQILNLPISATTISGVPVRGLVQCLKPGHHDLKLVVTVGANESEQVVDPNPDNNTVTRSFSMDIAEPPPTPTPKATQVPASPAPASPTPPSASATPSPGPGLISPPPFNSSMGNVGPAGASSVGTAVLAAALPRTGGDSPAVLPTSGAEPGDDGDRMFKGVRRETLIALSLGAISVLLGASILALAQRVNIREQNANPSR